MGFLVLKNYGALQNTLGGIMATDWIHQRSAMLAAES